MPKDIENRDDIVLLVDNFYANVMTSPTIGYFFSDVVRVDWSVHLPKMYAFWETMLFDKRTYTQDPYMPHYDVNEIQPLTEVEFNEWLTLFHESVDEYFVGKVAEKAKLKAISVAKVMMRKIHNLENFEFENFKNMK